jgi:hypothetical protein
MTRDEAAKILDLEARAIFMENQNPDFPPDYLEERVAAESAYSRGAAALRRLDELEKHEVGGATGQEILHKIVAMLDRHYVEDDKGHHKILNFDLPVEGTTILAIDFQRFRITVEEVKA